MMTQKIMTDKNQWERFIEKYSPTALFQQWDWGDVQERVGENVRRYGYYKKTKLIAVVCAVIVRAKRGNFLHVRHGPILTKWNSSIFKQILLHLKKIALENTCVCIRISPCVEQNEKIESMFHSFGGIPAAIHAMDAEHAWVLDLEPSEQQLLANMRKTTRYEIRRAEKIGVTISKSSDPKAVDIFMELYRKTSLRQKFIEHKGIEEEFAVFAKNGNAIAVTGFFQGNPLASAIVLFSGKQAIYHHGASLLSKIPVSYLVQWEAVREAKRRGMKRYNFWGIAPETSPHHPWHGLTMFKTGFGGRIVDTIHAYDFPLSWNYWFFRIVELVRKRIKGYS